MGRGGSKKGNRKQWATKTRTGCLTCKKKRVKCDEGKPFCRRCYASAIECDGYQDLSHRPSKPCFESTATWRVSSLPVTSKDISQTNLPSNHGAYHGNQLTNESEFVSPEFKSGISGIGTMSSPNHAARGSATLTVKESNHHHTGNHCTHVQASPEDSSYTISRPLSPYSSHPVETQALQTYLELMPPMGRSEIGLHYWTVTIPTLAWLYEPVRHAQTAMITVWDSLRRKDNKDVFREHDVLATKWVNKAIRGLIGEGHSELPPEVPIVVSTLFWLMELSAGRNANSLQHLAAGYKIATSLGPDTEKLSDPTIPKYVSYFIDTLTGSVHTQITGLSMTEKEKRYQASNRFARAVVIDGMDRLTSAMQRVESTEGKHKELALKILSFAQLILSEYIATWPIEYRSRKQDDDESSQAKLQDVIASHSPFIQLIGYFEDFFADNNEEHLRKFQLEFRPSVDRFVNFPHTEIWSSDGVVGNCEISAHILKACSDQSSK